MKKFFTLSLLLIFTLSKSNAQVFQTVVGFATPTPYAIAPDGFGNMYVGGYSTGTQILSGQSMTSNGGRDFWIAKYDVNGNMLWLTNGGGTTDDQTNHLAVDNNGYVYATLSFNTAMTFAGTTYTSHGGDDCLIIKYDPYGNIIWTKQIGSTGQERGTFLSWDWSGNIHIVCPIYATTYYIGATMYSTGTGKNIIHAKLNPTGTVLTTNNIGNYTGAASYFEPTCATVDGGGNIFMKVYVSNATCNIGGTSITTNFANSQIFAKLDATGTMVWHHELDYYSGPAESCVTNSLGDVYFTGDWDSHFTTPDTTISQTVASDDAFLIKYNSAGVYQWVRAYGSTGTDNAPFVFMNANQEVVVAGIFSQTMNVGAYTLTPSGSDFYVAKFTQGGTTTAAYCSHAPNNEVTVMAAGIDNSGNVSVTTWVYPTTNFGPFVLTGTLYYAAVTFVDNACQASGKVYRDYSNNGNLDNGETGMKEVIVQTNTGGYYAMSGQQGDYQLFTLPGMYSISIPNVPLYHTLTTGATQSATFSVLGQLDSLNNFGLYPTPGIRDLKIFVTNIVPARPNKFASFFITYKNIGTDTSSGYVALGHPASLTFSYANPTQSWMLGDSLQWNFSNLIPGESRTIQVYVHIPNSALLGDTWSIPCSVVSTGNAEQTPADNYLSYQEVCISSFDPNEKTVTPSAVPVSYVTAGTNYFEYKIRFQNTGNDTAFNILVRDSMDSNLDLGSFELLGTSHACQVSIRNPRVLEFHFDNINLPDSTTNEIESHGAISFRIKANVAMPTPGYIYNTGNIYFDFNAPVPTSTAIIAVGNVGVNNIDANKIQLSLFPNPASNNLFINVKAENSNSILEIELTDLAGRILKSVSVDANRITELSLDEMTNGIYLVNLKQNGIVMSNGKVVVSK